MPHPQMFDDEDPLLARVSAVALGFPAARMKVSHGRPAFWTAPQGKVFCYVGGSEKRAGEWIAHDAAIMVLLEPAEREALLDDPRVFVPAYLGPSGWLGLDLTDDGAAAEQWDEVAELIDASYRRTAAKRLVAELDARG